MIFALVYRRCVGSPETKSRVGTWTISSAFAMSLAMAPARVTYSGEEIAGVSVPEAENATEIHRPDMRRLDEAERQRHEELREKQLEAEVALWRRAEDIRAHVRAALALPGDGDAVTGDGRPVRESMHGALDYAGRNDPLRLDDGSASRPENDNWSPSL
jgi:hypothetical protein